MYYLTDTTRYLLEYPEDESDLSLTRIGSDPVKFSSIFTPSSPPPIPSSPSSSSYPATSTSTSTTSTTTSNTTVNHLDHPSELPPDPKPSQSCWSHIVFWSIDDHCVRSSFPLSHSQCILETDYPVVHDAACKPTAVHLHNAQTPFTEDETLKLYLNSVISSAQQVVIYNIADNSPQ